MKKYIISILLFVAFSQTFAQIRPTYYLKFDALDIQSETAIDVIFSGNTKLYEKLFVYYRYYV